MTIVKGNERSKETATRLVLARHGETELNASGRFRGRADPPLTRRGERQAHDLAGGVEALEASAIYCSPRLRAMATAGAVGTMLTTPPVVHRMLDDFDYGDWTGKTHNEAAFRWPTLYSLWLRNPDAVQFPNGEPVRQAAARISGFLGVMRREHPGQTVVAVTHDAIIRLAICSVLDVGLAPYHRIAIDLVSTTGVELAETQTLLWVNRVPTSVDDAEP